MSGFTGSTGLSNTKTHPHETITVVGSIAHPAAYRLELTNVRIIPSVEPDQMPFLYRKHRKLVRMTTEDGLPRMMHEALLCGLKVEFNGKAVKEIPPEREPSEFVKSFRKILSEISAA